MAPVGAFMVAYGGAIASGMSALAQGYSMYSQSVQSRLAKGAASDAAFMQAQAKKDLPSIPSIVPTSTSTPAQREADVEAQIITNRRRMASSAKRKTVATSGAGITVKAETEKKTLLGQTGALSAGIV